MTEDTWKPKIISVTQVFFGTLEVHVVEIKGAWVQIGWEEGNEFHRLWVGRDKLTIKNTSRII